MHSFLYVGIILLTGILSGRLCKKINLPEVTGYLIGGLLIGHSFLGLIPLSAAKELSLISEAALGFIAFSIGLEFNFNHLKKIGKSAFIITFFQVLSTMTFITIGMLCFNKTLSFSLVIGAIGTATAPAATIMIIKQYKAKGPVVNTLLPVVAIDDAMGVIIFGISLAIAKALLIPTGNLLSSILHPFIEIILAFIIGVSLGLILAFLINKSEGKNKMLSVVVAIMMIAIGVSSEFNISPLLLCMSIGGTVTNILPNTKPLHEISDHFTPPIFIAFFTLAGAELDISTLSKIGYIGAAYVIFRIIGKILGAYLGARIVHSPKVVQKYLGLTLIPQAGVAIGLALIAENTLPNGDTIRTIILAATVIYELIGPLMTKYAIFKAGEAHIDKKKSLSI
ncbi:cation:proton antiporter [Oceanirhabdus sp. W0125-5]|uniref:cation:proton antiporter n=1 Tax=Oceanirhabdus sp. W0125-5 TaxID=2999116 RepID=UPI0022F2EE6C|nr:cation:proton antiporter [Oceanirhabdus sp. W0125-5]WBW99266.1 cation:proton antiporter [Oceanirhabdus sp. W0125-5]